MNSDQIKHLATLSRLAITQEEADQFTKEFEEIVGYVTKIKEVVSEKDSTGIIESNEVKNVLREDEVHSYPNPEVIINEAPSHQDDFVKVKKILNQ